MSDDAREQYTRLVTLAAADLHRLGFNETAVETFLERRCGVPFDVLLKVPPPPPPFMSHSTQHRDQVALWVQALEDAKALLEPQSAKEFQAYLRFRLNFYSGRASSHANETLNA